MLLPVRMMSKTLFKLKTFLYAVFLVLLSPRLTLIHRRKYKKWRSENSFGRNGSEGNLQQQRERRRWRLKHLWGFYLCVIVSREPIRIPNTTPNFTLLYKILFMLLGLSVAFSPTFFIRYASFRLDSLVFFPFINWIPFNFFLQFKAKIIHITLSVY